MGILPGRHTIEGQLQQRGCKHGQASFDVPPGRTLTITTSKLNGAPRFEIK